MVTAELYGKDGRKVGSREYEEERDMRADAWQEGWTLFAQDGDVYRYIVKGDRV